MAGRLLSLTLAVFLPLLIVTGTLDALERFRTFADKREDKNVGKVINGRVFEGGAVSMIETKLDQTRPDVIILGNSLSNTDIQPPVLARQLGLPKSKVQKFSVPNSMGAHWYAILKNRVYARGHKPKLVILLSDLQSLLALAPRSEASYLNLSVQLSDEEPVVDQLLGKRLFWLERVRENRGKLRDKAMILARNAIVDALIYGRFSPADDKKTEAALARVFDTSRTDMRLYHDVIPIFNTQNARDLLPFDPSQLPRPEGSFLPHIADLVQRGGGTLVILRPPMSPLLPKNFGDIVEKESEQAVGPLVRSYGGVFLDLRGVEMNHSHFVNQDHMTSEGARRFTEILAELLKDLQLEPGRASSARPEAVDLLKSVALVDHQFVNLELPVTFFNAPPPLPRPERPFLKGRGRVLFFPTDSFAFMADPATVEVTPHASRCSPVRVLEDGAPLPLPNVGCDEVQRHGFGRTCHTPEKLFFSTSDDTSPYANERAYTLALDPRRSCDAAFWLYPGDRARVDARQGDLSVLQEGADTLRIVVQDMGAGRRGGEPIVTVRVKEGEQTLLERVIPVEDLAFTSVLALSRPITAASRQVSVSFDNASSRFLLVTRLLLERYGEGAAMAPDAQDP